MCACVQLVGLFGCLFDSIGWFIIDIVQSGETALHFAAELGHVHVVQVLCEALADVNLQNKVVHK